MAISYVGRAAVWGHSASIASVTTNCLGTILIQNYRLKKSAETYDINDKIQTEGRIAANRKETLTLEGIFSSILTPNTTADANTQCARTPSINNIVAVTDAIDTEIAGNWVVADAEKSADVKSPKSISLTLERFPDSVGMNGTTTTVIV